MIIFSTARQTLTSSTSHRTEIAIDSFHDSALLPRSEFPPPSSENIHPASSDLRSSRSTIRSEDHLLSHTQKSGSEARVKLRSGGAVPHSLLVLKTRDHLRDHRSASEVFTRVCLLIFPRVGRMDAAPTSPICQTTIPFMSLLVNASKNDHVMSLGRRGSDRDNWLWLWFFAFARSNIFLLRRRHALRRNDGCHERIVEDCRCSFFRSYGGSSIFDHCESRSWGLRHKLLTLLNSLSGKGNEVGRRVPDVLPGR